MERLRSRGRYHTLADECWRYCRKGSGIKTVLRPVVSKVESEFQFEVTDDGTPLSGGAVVYTVDLGHIVNHAMTIKPIKD